MTAESVSRRGFVQGMSMVGAVTLGTGSLAAGAESKESSPAAHNLQPSKAIPMNEKSSAPDEILLEKIRRARLSGPVSVSQDATVAEFAHDGALSILRKGTNHWVCIPGNENIVGHADMCCDPMGLQWMQDVIARKPKPTNATPGLIYMLNGATQRSYADPFDTTSPAIPIGPHWMILWPFDAKEAGLSTVMRDAGTMVMFAGTPYAHLHVCGSPWDGNEYHPGDRIVRTLTYGQSAR